MRSAHGSAPTSASRPGHLATSTTELAAAHERAAAVGADATVWAARADTPGIVRDEAERLRADAAAACAEADRLAEQIARLEAVDAARARWFAHTAVTRDNAERARVELRARGVDPDAADDRITAGDWLAAHRAEQAATERELPVREEHELWDEERARHDAERSDADEPSAEVDTPDVRDVSVADATETADPAERRRVPLVDETTRAVTRAQVSLAEITARQAADGARAKQDAADRAAAEAARREELGRWSADETTSSDADADADDTAGGNEDLARDR